MKILHLVAGNLTGGAARATFWLYKALQSSGIESVNLTNSVNNIKGKLHWMYVVSPKNLTYYMLNQKRGKEAMDAMEILPQCTGIVAHDHTDKLRTLHYGQSNHLRCYGLDYKEKLKK